MPKLCDIVKPGVPAKVRRIDGRFQWNGHYLTVDDRTEYCTIETLFADDWQLDEPTVESVLRERGYGHAKRISGDIVFSRIGDTGTVSLTIPESHFPSRPMQALALCDFLDQYR